MATTARSEGPRADPARVLTELRALARFGAVGRGVTRPAFSEADMAGRRWLADRFAEAGLVASVDGVGNVVGRDPAARLALLAGSHSDSVPRGGWLDGAMGVLFGLEAARAWRRARPDAPVGIDVVSFADEEGTFDACVGSRAFCGLWSGPPTSAGLGAALASAGLSGRPEPGLDPARHKAYIEAHIEQGPRLEAAGIGIGVVQGIVGSRRQRVRFSGRADHAGTTPIGLRQDAGRALFTFCATLDAEFRRAAAPDAVWNMGVFAVAPGAANVVPSSAEVVVEYRHLDRAEIDRMMALVREVAGRGSLPVTIEQVGALEPAAMDDGLVAALAAAARGRGIATLAMPSGAGHDAMVVARRLPSGMMFVPSMGGRSHDPEEDTSEADLARGLEVYVDWAFGVLDGLS